MYALFPILFGQVKRKKFMLAWKWCQPETHPYCNSVHHKLTDPISFFVWIAFCGQERLDSLCVN